MAYIPREHKKYNILPSSRKGNWEVVSYDSDMLNQLIDVGCDISYPYQPTTLEEYYNEIDNCIKQCPKIESLLNDYKNDLINRNNKTNWGIVKYIGESNDSFTNGRYYYVPMFKKNDQVIIDGIIDDEEFTSYVEWTDSNFNNTEFEVIVDPFDVLFN